MTRAILTTTAASCLAVILGCSPPPKAFDTATPYIAPDLDLEFDSVGWGCDPEGYFFEVYTVGISSGGRLYIYQTGAEEPVDEAHEIEVYMTAENRLYTHLYLELLTSAPDVSPSEGESETVYSCDDEARMQETLTFVIKLDDEDGNADVVCVVWGDNPDAAPANECARTNTEMASRML